MKNFTNNLKQFTSHLSARWLIMALMMLVGTSSAWAATITSDGTARMYYNMATYDWWIIGNGTQNFAYFFNKTTGKSAWSSKSVNYSGNTYYVTIPEGDWEWVILTRDKNTTADWDIYNQTVDIELESTSNYLSSFQGQDQDTRSTTWGTAVKPTSTASLSASSTSVDTGVNVTLTPSLTSNQTINDIKSTSYTISPSTGASISGNTFTATEAGTYTVTATVTYNPDGYSSLTSTATATKTITVNNPITITSYQLAGFDEWNSPITMTPNGNNTYTCEKILEAKTYATNTSSGFKIIENYSNSDKKWYGNDGTMARNGQSVQSGGWTMEEGKNNCGITADVAGTYTFTFDATNKKLTVTYPPECITTSFSWTTAPVNMNYGETKNIVATLNPAEAGTVSYTADPAGRVTINNNTYTAVGKGAVTITATAALNDGYCAVDPLPKEITVTCPTPDQPKLSEGKAILDNCGNDVDGSILIENYANYGAGYTFKLDGTPITPANDGTISVSTPDEYTVTVTNECGTSNQASITITKTTIRVPRTDFEVSISYPQVPYANNNGSIYIDLSGSESDVKYYLYKDGSKVVDSEKQGDGNGLRWDGIVETGTYTVKAYNPCSQQGEIGMTGSVEYTCMSNLNIAFADDKTTFCPGESTTITITFDGTGKGDATSNANRYGWQWIGENYDYTSVYLTESGVTMPVTINADGSIQLNVKTCNGTLSSDPLNFTVVTAPDKPQLDDYAKDVCTGETAEITISEYNDSYTYQLYKNSTIVETPEFNAGVFTVSEAGSYTVKAVEAECSLESVSSDTFTLSARGTTITPSVAEIHPYEVVTFTAGEQVKWALYTNPSSGSQLSDDDAKYSGKDTAYITKGESTTTKFKGEAANGYVIHATVGDCTASYTFNVVEDPDNCQ